MLLATERRKRSKEATASKIHQVLREAQLDYDLTNGHTNIFGTISW